MPHTTREMPTRSRSDRTLEAWRSVADIGLAKAFGVLSQMVGSEVRMVHEAFAMSIEAISQWRPGPSVTLRLCAASGGSARLTVAFANGAAPRAARAIMAEASLRGATPGIASSALAEAATIMTGRFVAPMADLAIGDIRVSPPEREAGASARATLEDTALAHRASFASTRGDIQGTLIITPSKGLVDALGAATANGPGTARRQAWQRS